MLQLDWANVTADRIGLEHGLVLADCFDTYGEAVHKQITRLYGSKNTPGAWTRWLTLGEDHTLAERLKAYQHSVRGQFTDLVVLGIGGSSLGAHAMLKALLHPYWNQLSSEARGNCPRYYFVENVDSDQIAPLFDMLDPKTTLFAVITKSGTTAETMSTFMLAKQWLEDASVSPRGHVVAVTDPAKGVLRQIADEEGYVTFDVPDDVGGRFSVFSAVGLLPAALCGLDIEALQRGIREIDAVLQNPDVRQNPAAQNALIQYLMYRRGKHISVFMPYSHRLAAVSDWYVQLWAESLGKKHDTQGNTVHIGPTPVRAVGVTDQHSQVQLFNEGPNDKIFTFVCVESPEHERIIPAQFTDVADLAYLNNQPFSKLMQAEFESTRASLTRNGRPNVTLTLDGKLDTAGFAQLLYFLEVQTAFAGGLFDIDTFDQPGVELAKQYTYALMGRPGYGHLIAEARGQNTIPISG